MEDQALLQSSGSIEVQRSLLHSEKEMGPKGVLADMFESCGLKGVGGVTSQGSHPIAKLYISEKNGALWVSWMEEHEGNVQEVRKWLTSINPCDTHQANAPSWCRLGGEDYWRGGREAKKETWGCPNNEHSRKPGILRWFNRSLSYVSQWELLTPTDCALCTPLITLIYIWLTK